ncbi:MAG: DUF3788 family protein [Bacteroidales bacterium]
MDEMLLRDPSVIPSAEIIEKALQGSYSAYTEMLGLLPGDKKGITPEWRYYNDGKAWLCKVVSGKKTIFWLSVWPGYFRVTFYFTEKTGAAIKELDIDASIKTEFQNNKHIGKLIPLTFRLSNKDQLSDLMKVVHYKISCK